MRKRTEHLAGERSHVKVEDLPTPVIRKRAAPTDALSAVLVEAAPG
jgi:hypothetical protein